jgi:hypothetical protein
MVVSPTHRPALPPRKYSWYSFLLEAESTTEELCQRKIPVTPIGNRTRDLPAFSAVPQPTAPQRASYLKLYCGHIVSHNHVKLKIQGVQT